MHAERDGLVTGPAIHTRDLEDPVDLLHVAGEGGLLFESAGGGFAGQGEALRVEVPYADGELQVALGEVRRALASLRGGAGVQPVAFVSVPFVNTRPVIAVVPQILVSTGEGPSVTSIGDLQPPARFDVPAVHEAPSAFTITSSRSPKEWCEAVEEAVRRMRAGALDKVVLAREILLEADAPMSQMSAMRQLRRSYPSAYRFAIDGFIGASPELLISRKGRDVHSNPLAGTLPRSSDREVDEAMRTALIRSAKTRSEHRFLSDMVRETLAPFCSDLSVPPSPEVLSLSNVHHLSTPVEGVLRTLDADVLDLVAALHPTPAVGGRPTDDALDLIAELEELDRGRYAGAVGWVDADGDGEFAVAIRCAQLEGRRARLYAGNGIVAASNPQRELEETQWKLQAMLSALVRP